MAADGKVKKFNEYRVFGRDRGLRTGDYIEFGMLGAYSSATATSFNGFRPGVYMDVLEGTEFSCPAVSAAAELG